MWWDRDYVTFDTTTYEILTAGNAENSKSINFSGNIMYRPMPLASIMIWGYSWNSTISDKARLILMEIPGVWGLVADSH